MVRLGRYKYTSIVDTIIHDTINFKYNKPVVDEYDKLRQIGAIIHDDFVAYGNMTEFNIDFALDTGAINAVEYVYLGITAFRYYEQVRKFKTVLYPMSIADLKNRKSEIKGNSEIKEYADMERYDLFNFEKQAITDTSLINDATVNYTIDLIKHLDLKHDYPNQLEVGSLMSFMGNEVGKVPFVRNDYSSSIGINNYKLYETKLSELTNSDLTLTKSKIKIDGVEYTRWVPSDAYKLNYELAYRSAKKSLIHFNNNNVLPFTAMLKNSNIISLTDWVVPIYTNKNEFKYKTKVNYTRKYWQVVESYPVTLMQFHSLVKDRGIDLKNLKSIDEWHTKNQLSLEKHDTPTENLIGNVFTVDDNLQYKSMEDAELDDIESAFISKMTEDTKSLEFDYNKKEYIALDSLFDFKDDGSKFNGAYIVDKKLYKNFGHANATKTNSKLNELLNAKVVNLTDLED